MSEQLQQIETRTPGGVGEPVGQHFVKGQLAADLAQGRPQTNDEVDIDPENPDGGRRGD